MFSRYSELNMTLKLQGPFDGILSFSQGAALATLLCGLREQKPGKLHWPKLYSFFISETFVIIIQSILTDRSWQTVQSRLDCS